MSSIPVRAEKSEEASPAAAAATDQTISDRLPDLVESLIELAVGVTVDSGNGDGKEIFTLPPNRMAAEYLINRVLGKPTDRPQTGDRDELNREIDMEMQNIRNLNIDELIQLHRQTIGEV